MRKVVPMHRLNRIWQDIRRGDNIDLYIAVIIAISLAVLNILGITPLSSLPPITLAVLGLLAISTLGNRHQVEKLMEQMNQPSGSLFLEDHPDSYKNDFLNSSEILLIGVTLDRLIRNKYSVIESKLRKGDRIRFLLVHPEGAACEIAVKRMYIKTKVDNVRELIRNSISSLNQLKRIAPNNLEIRTIQDPLTFGGVMMNTTSAKGILYIAHHPQRNVGRSQPKFVLHAKDGHWYEFFKLEVEAMWDAGTEWKEPAQTN